MGNKRNSELLQLMSLLLLPLHCYEWHYRRHFILTQRVSDVNIALTEREGNKSQKKWSRGTIHQSWYQQTEQEMTVIRRLMAQHDTYNVILSCIQVNPSINHGTNRQNKKWLSSED